jgi:hypothetical protein
MQPCSDRQPALRGIRNHLLMTAPLLRLLTLLLQVQVLMLLPTNASGRTMCALVLLVLLVAPAVDATRVQGEGLCSP